MTAPTSALTCRDVAAFLGAYVAGELGAKQHRAFDAHVAQCPDCRTYVRQYEQTRRLAKQSCDDAVAAGIPEELVAAILAARAAASDDE